jgi:hypothetical protein
LSEPTVETKAQLEAVLADVSLKRSTLDLDWKFLVRDVNEFEYLDVNVTHQGKPQLWNYGSLLPTPLPADSGKNFDVKFRARTTGWLVQVEFTRPDCDTGEPGRGKGRQEFVPAGTSVSGVVKTAWLLLELVVRHELLEAFLYRGHRIFNPHHTVAELMAVRPAEVAA